MYEKISETIENGKKKTVLKSGNGSTIICRSPIETSPERKQAICKALIQFVYPDLDLSQVKYMEVKL